MAEPTKMAAAPGRRASGQPALLFVVCLIAAGCAAHTPQPSLIASVPDASRRLKFAVPAEDAGARAAMDDALAAAVCLVRSGRSCEDPEANPGVCTIRDESEVRRALKPVFDALPAVRLTSASAISDQISKLIPDAEATTAVNDARREEECRVWRGEDGPCVAIHYGEIWILLSGRVAGEVEDADSRYRMEIFLDKPCREDVT